MAEAWISLWELSISIVPIISKLSNWEKAESIVIMGMKIEMGINSNNNIIETTCEN